MKRLLLVTLSVVLMSGLIITGCTSTITTTTTTPPPAGKYGGYTQEEFDALEVTTVIKSEESPTGYYVTFRYKDPDAKQVQISGEWKFTDLAHGGLRQSENKLPDEWEDGDTVWYTNGDPAADMTKNEETGVWSYTIPLPNGTWPYYYQVTLSSGHLRSYFDPNNPPKTIDGYNEGKSVEAEYPSTVYVPWDAEKQAKTAKVTEQAPLDGENGEVLYTSVTVADDLEIPFGIYLPYGFDAERPEPYPVFVLGHGGSGNEHDWVNKGALANIMDNMIAEGRLEPTVVITPGWDVGVSPERKELFEYTNNDILPYMVENYNVAEDPARRAFGGLSMGGALTMLGYFHYTDYYDYWLAMSAPVSTDILPEYDVEKLSGEKLCLAYGCYDFVKFNSIYNVGEQDEEGNMEPLFPAISGLQEGSVYEYCIRLGEEHIPFTVFELPYGHEYVFWRQCLVHFADEMLWK